eukprot:7988642-Prorocentrum_lima.AAC.1
MTSSLVGSEMCIRDSLRTGQKLESTCAKPISRLSAVGAISQGGQPVEDAVSYTHLTLPTICSV